MSARPIVALYCGREVSSWSPEWLAETGERFRECLHIEGLSDRSDRRARLAVYERSIADATGSESTAAEARKRLEDLIMARWRARTGNT